MIKIEPVTAKLLAKIALQIVADREKRQKFFMTVAAIVAVPILIIIMAVSIVTRPLNWIRNLFSDEGTYVNEYVLEQEDYTFIRELDAEVNALIQEAEANAYQASFIMTNEGQYSETRLRTSIIQFSALFAALHENALQDGFGEFRDEMRALHEQTYSLEIEWYVIYVPVEVYVETIVYVGGEYITEYVPAIEYQPRDAVRIYFRIYTMAEMLEILNLDESQSELVLGVIEIAEALGYYGFVSGGIAGLPPEEIAYILYNVPLAWPTHYRNISSPFGWRTLNGRPDFHAGIDIPMVIGRPVYASITGTVTTSTHSVNANGVGAGHMIVITSDCGRVVTRYLHLSERLVSVGMRVEIGAVIARSGNSGATGTSRGHLHYDIAIDGTRVDPLLLLP